MKRCCVLIPYYNDGLSLIRSLESIERDGNHADVVVIDDGSNIFPADEVLQNYSAALDVTALRLDCNKGIEHALNKGLEYAIGRYEYIARLDCGDACKKSRLSKQIKFLDDNGSCQLVGSWVDFVNMGGEFLYTLKQPGFADSIRKQMFVNCAFTHPAVMFRSSLIREVGFYPLDRPAAEDYALFFKVVRMYETANIQESLVECEINPKGISSQKRRIQIRSRIRIIVDNFDFSFHAFYGLARSLALLYTPRNFTVFVKKTLQRLMVS